MRYRQIHFLSATQHHYESTLQTPLLDDDDFTTTITYTAHSLRYFMTHHVVVLTPRQESMRAAYKVKEASFRLYGGLYDY